MAGVRRLLMSAAKITSLVNTSSSSLFPKKNVLLPSSECHSWFVHRSYHGSNRYKRMRAERQKERLGKRLEIEYGITNKPEFNFNEWIKANYSKELTAFQHRIGAVFDNEKLLWSVFAHSSFREEVNHLHSILSNSDGDTQYPDLQERFRINENLSEVTSEKLALLGFDRVTSVIKENLYKRYSNITSSICSDVSKYLTSRETVLMIAKNLGLEDMLMLSRELENTKDIDEEYQLEFTRDDILCDTFFALIGAIEKDLGVDEATAFVEDFITPLVDHTDLSQHVKLKDPHDELLKILSMNGVDSNISARVIVETGVDSHFPFYFVGIYHRDRKIGEGSGYSAYTARMDAFRNTIFSCVEGEIDFRLLKTHKNRL